MFNRHTPFIAVLPVVALVALHFAAPCQAWTPPRHTGLDYSLQFADLPYFYSGTTTWQNSSRDPSGSNGDGLGCDRWLYFDGEYVIMDEPGPGCIEDIWMTSIPQGNIKIYFDNEANARVNVNVAQFFSGNTSPFLTPLAGNDNASSGGFYCRVPMAYSQRVKVALTHPPCYWHILWNRYPPGTPVTTFTTGLNVAPLIGMMNAPGTDPKSTIGNITQSGNMNVPTGQGRTIFTYNGAGSIASLKIDPSPNFESVLMQTWVNVYFDGAEHPQISAPIGLFFGCANREVNVRGLPIGMSTTGYYYCYLPMPFWQSVRIDLYNGQSGDVFVPFEVQYKTTPYAGDAGYLCARYKKEHATTQGVDYLILETSGTGHYMGTTVLFTAPGGSQGFLEGDERIYVDGSQTPQIYGTGTEDYFEGGYYFNRGAFSLPLHGMPFHDNNGSERFNMYRFHLGDRVPFTSHIKVGMEHGGVNEVDGWYSSVAYYYWKPQVSAFATDMLDVGNAPSESQHGYTRLGEIGFGNLTSQYEGDQDFVSITDDGRRHQNASSFDLGVAPPNRGVFLRRRTDQGSGRQRGAVSVNTTPTGEWYQLNFNSLKRWVDADFFIPQSRTESLSSIHVDISASDWNEYRYTPRSLVDVNTLQTWQAESLTPVASSGKGYNNVGRSDINWTWGGSAVAEYQGTQAGDYVTLRMPVSQAGWYAVWPTLSRADNAAICQVSVNGQAAIESIDLYDHFFRRGPIAGPGVILQLNPGNADLRIEAIGRNTSSNNFRIPIDSVHLALLEPPAPPPATPTGTPPTPTPSRTPTPTPPAVLFNGGFENGFDANNCGLSWNRYFDADYAVPFQDRTDIRHGGAHAQGYQLPVPPANSRYAGVYQRIPAVPGHQYRITAWAYSIYNGAETNPWDNFILRLGVDPLGDTSFRSSSVQWVEYNATHGVWHQQTMTVTAINPFVTVFLDGFRKWTSGVDGAYAIFDDVTYEDLTPTTPTPTFVGGSPTPTRTPTVTPSPSLTPIGPSHTPGPTSTFTPTPTRTPTQAPPTPTGTPIGGVNLLNNPSFEDSNGPSHPFWTHTQFNTNGQFPAPGAAQHGAKWASYSYGGGGSTSVEIYQTVSAIPGHNYHIAAYFQVGGSESGAITASLRWFDGAYPGSGISNQLAVRSWTWPEVQGVWTEVTGNFTPGANQITFIVRAEVQGWGSGLNVDNCRLIDLSPPSTPTPTAPPTNTPPPTNTTLPTATGTPTTVPTATNTPPVSGNVLLDPAGIQLHHPPSSALHPSATAAISIRMQSAANLGSFQMGIGYNASALMVSGANDVALGAFLGSTGNVVTPSGPVIDNNAGLISYGAAASGGNPGPNGNGDLARIVWSTKFVAQKTIVPLSFQSFQATTMSGGAHGASTNGGAITVCFFADVDCDDDVDIVDVQQVSGHWNSVEGGPQYDRRFDIDKDRDIDIADVQLVAGRWNKQAPFSP